MSLARGWVWLLLGGAPFSVLAAETVPQTSGLGAFLQAVMGLGLVLGLMYVFFWLLRRYGPAQNTAQGVVKVVGGVMLGPRERLVVVEVEDTWVLVGVAAGNVRTLHTLAKPEGYTAPIAMPGGGFPDKLTDLLRRKS